MLRNTELLGTANYFAPEVKSRADELTRRDTHYDLSTRTDGRVIRRIRDLVGTVGSNEGGGKPRRLARHASLR